MIISHDGAPFSITCSFGVTSFRCVTTGFEEALSHADKALYQAKSDGRNQVVEYDNDSGETHNIEC
jgi:PleD family two-component response regulator